jgi:hypothetical protein
MSLITNLFRRNKPFWEKSFTPQNLDLFYSLVREYFSNYDEVFSIQNGYVISKDKQRKIDLRNLAQDCQGSEVAQWASIIENYFQQVEKVSSTVFEYSASNFSDISDNIVVRLWPEGTLQNVGSDNIIYRKELSGTISTLALYLPDSVIAVTPKMVNAWEKNLNDLFTLGLRNVTRICEPDIVETVLANEVKTLMITKDNNFFTATHILLLENHPRCLGTFGALVSAPIRDLVMCYPINEKQDIGQIAYMLADITQDVCRKGPGSVSPYLYWYYRANYNDIQYNREKKSVVVPRGLTELLKSSQ